jgi:DNA-binding Lrp family transcriptional regulator
MNLWQQVDHLGIWARFFDWDAFSHTRATRSPMNRKRAMRGVSAVVLIKAETSLINELAEQLAEVPGVAEVFSVAGQYDLVALVKVRENEELADVITHRMRKLNGILETQTLIAFRVYSKAELSAGFDMD